MVGAFNPSEKYESQLGLLFPINGKNKKHLVVSTPLKNMKVSWDYYSQ